MAMTKQAKITSKGQVTIPAEVRSAQGLHEGDTVSFEASDGNQAMFKPVREKGAFAKYGAKSVRERH